MLLLTSKSNRGYETWQGYHRDQCGRWMDRDQLCSFPAWLLDTYWLQLFWCFIWLPGFLTPEFVYCLVFAYICLVFQRVLSFRKRCLTTLYDIYVLYTCTIMIIKSHNFKCILHINGKRAFIESSNAKTAKRSLEFCHCVIKKLLGAWSKTPSMEPLMTTSAASMTHPLVRTCLRHRQVWAHYWMK